jgi:hypothetical protein
MRYSDGNIPMIGDVVEIDGKYRSVVRLVLAPATRAERIDPEQSYVPSTGLFVDTDFGGPVHYPTVECIRDENLRLISRAPGGSSAT